MTPYYADESVTLYHADMREVLPTLGSFDLIFTSPPYNLGTKNGGPSGMHAGSLAARTLSDGYATYADAMPQDQYDEWQTQVVHDCWDHLTESGALFYQHKPRVQGGEVILPTKYGADLPLRQIITWDRGTGMNFSRSFFLPKSEWIVIWARPAWRLRSKEASQIGDVWRVPPDASAEHPAPFPVTLPTLALEATGAQTVLDPFAGGGTTLRAAKNCGRKAVGIELSEQYCEMIASRLSQEVLPF